MKRAALVVTKHSDMTYTFTPFTSVGEARTFEKAHRADTFVVHAKDVAFWTGALVEQGYRAR